MTETSPVIETRALTKRYGDARGITDIDLFVPAGEAFGLLGPNGAGKTTLVRTLLGLLHATSGSARLFGLDARADRVAVHARLGNLAGDFAADPRLTGRDLLSFCAEVRGMPGLGRADELAERFAADLDRPLGELSRGNRQKVGIIQAAFHEPELLVLDEPTSGLDPLMQEEFLRLVAEHHRSGGTVLMSSHELDEVQRVCERVGIIRNGRLAAVGSVEDLRGHALHHVRVRFADATATEGLGSLPGISGLTVQDGTAHLDLVGPLDPLLQLLAGHPVEDLEIAQPSLEEGFLAFYRDAEEAW